MPPKQATLGKFFGNPNGRTPKSQQSTLSFKKSKESHLDGDGDTIKSDGLNEETEDKEDVQKHIQTDGTGQPDIKTEEPAADGTVEEALASSGNGHLTDSKSPPKRSNRQMKEEDEANNEDEDDEEPVRKRSRRVDSKAQSAPTSKKVTSSTSSEGPPKPKDASLKNSKKEVKSNQPSPNANSREKTEFHSKKQKRASEKTITEAPEEKPPSADKAGNQPTNGRISDQEDDPDEFDEGDSPEETAREKPQSALKPSGKDPYPDWKPGEPVPYAALCTTFSLIEMTTKRLAITSHCALFLRQVLRLTPKDLLPTVQLMINKLAADYAGIELGIGESLIMKSIGESTGRSLAVIKADQAEIGDLGLVAAKSRSNQPTMFKPKPLTVRGVLDGLMSIATASGDGSQTRKTAGIKKLLSAADAAIAGKGSKGVDITKDKGGASESKFIIRFLEGKLRLGLAEKTVLVSLAHAMVYHEVEKKSGKLASSEKLAEGEGILKTVYSELPSYEVIIPTMVEHGIFHLREHCRLKPGVPLKPMLAKPTKSITEVLDRFENKEFTCEYKYDGERAQIHYVAEDSQEEYAKEASKPVKAAQGLSAIFSRNSEDLSKKYPDILAKLHTWIKPETKSFVLDCETVAWDLKEKKVLPFQQLMTRKRKDVKIEEVTVKVCVFAFDLLFYNGEAIVRKSLRERRKLLHQAFEEVESEFSFAQYGDTDKIDEIQTLLDESVKASCEGLMVKMLDTDDSSYEPSKRSHNWLKVKKDYLKGVGDSLDLVVLGAYYGKGKRTSVYGAFLLACYNSPAERYETVCNIGTGFSEAILEELHSKLAEHIIDRPKPFYVHSDVPKDQPDVWFEPRFVWEVQTADLTVSPRYKAGADELGNSDGKGISLRFPRFIKERDDKKPDDATQNTMVIEMYKKQEGLAKSKKPSVDDDFEY
ncbi:ATP-dependent DNA ligase Cdc17 [Lecanora helva]